MDLLSSPAAEWASYLTSGADLLLVARFAKNGTARLVHVNGRLERVLGYATHELTGKPLAVLHGGRVSSDEMTQMMRVMADGAQASGGTLLATKSGDLVYAEWDAQRVVRANEPLLLLTGRIIERRKRAALAPAADPAKLLAETIDAIALLAHDIRGPLNTVIGYADLIAETAGITQEVADHVRMIVRAANHVVDMTNEITLASRLDRGEYTPFVERFDVLGLIERTIALLPGADRIDLEAGADRIEMDGDLAALRHIVANLVGNALKYSPLPTRVHVALTADARTVRIRVSDRGIGIPAQEIPLIFDRFARASNARNSKVLGTGLGLYFVKQLVERWGGTIDLKSRAGSGTHVTIALPIRAPAYKM
jgi:PAS domain S-box-containing protein